jgi:nicotinamide phosphoribosyltransferase
MKATYGVVDGVGREIFKAPKTDDGGKHSAKGLLMVERIGNDFVLTDQATPQQENSGELVTMFEDGEFTNLQTLAEIRERLWPTK